MIFIDRCISERVAVGLRSTRDDVVWHDDVFAPDTLDTDWLQEVGIRGYLVITNDKKLRVRQRERQALIDGRVGCFIFVGRGNPTWSEQLDLLLVTLPEMERLFAEVPRPFAFTVDSTGRFTRRL